MEAQNNFTNTSNSFPANLTNSTRVIATKKQDIYNELPGGYTIILILILLLLFAVIGNCLVCWIVKVNPKMHCVTNYLLVNLAVSDFLLAFSGVFHVADFAVKNLNIGNVGCKFQINMVSIPYGSSVLTLTYVTYERYCAICQPITMHLSGMKERIKWVIPIIWLLSTAIFFPFIYYCGQKKGDDDQLSCNCTIPNRWAMNAHGIFLVLVFYVFPLITVIVCHFNVIRKLNQVVLGEATGNSSTRYLSRQKTVKMLLACLIIFFVTWTPYNILYFLKQIEIDYRRIYKYVWYPAIIMAISHCACNPVIYCLLGNNFRAGFKQVLCCRKCRLPSFLRAFSPGNGSSSEPTRQPELSTQQLDDRLGRGPTETQALESSLN